MKNVNASVTNDNRTDPILRPGKPRRAFLAFLFGRPSLTVGPYQVAIVIRDGRVVDIFSQGKKKLPRGEVQTYVASTAPFNLTFWLKDPGDPEDSIKGAILEHPVLTADDQPVTGRIDLMLSVILDEAERLLQLLGPSGHAIASHDIAGAIEPDLTSKVLALDIHSHTASDLRGNRGLLVGIYNSLQVELTSTFSRYGLRLDNFNVNWGLTPDERERIKEQRHAAAIREAERRKELDALTGLQRPAAPFPDTPQPTSTPAPATPARPTNTRRVTTERTVGRNSSMDAEGYIELFRELGFEPKKNPNDGKVLRHRRRVPPPSLYFNRNTSIGVYFTCTSSLDMDKFPSQLWSEIPLHLVKKKDGRYLNIIPKSGRERDALANIIYPG